MIDNNEINTDLLWYIKQYKSNISRKIKSKYSVSYYDSQIRRFTVALQERGLKDYKNLTMKDLLELFEEDLVLDPKPIRSFLRYLFNSNICAADFGFLVPNKKSRRRMPSFFSQKEISRVLESIDRSSSKGKRNYLILLLACRLGLNSRQICNIKYCDITEDEIHTRSASGKTLLFPLTDEIKKALIEHCEDSLNNSPYVVFGQEESNSMIYSRVSRIISTQFAKAGFSDERITGVRSLKNSLVKKLREEGVEYSVIAQGYDTSYKNIKSYKKIEYQILRECNLRIEINGKESFCRLLKGQDGISELY